MNKYLCARFGKKYCIWLLSEKSRPDFFEKKFNKHLDGKKKQAYLCSPKKRN